jgi:hypothetical protein
MLTASGAPPRTIFHECSFEVGIGFGVAEAGPA